MGLVHHGHVRRDAANRANEEDASLWRWFSAFYEEGRISWRHVRQGWLIKIDRKHLATEPDFDSALRSARIRHQALVTAKETRALDVAL
jgi:hypothetical protein